MGVKPYSENQLQVEFLKKNHRIKCICEKMHGYDVWCPWNPLPKFLNSCLMNQGFRPYGELGQCNQIGKVYWFNNYFFCPITVIRDCYFIHNVLMLNCKIHCPVITNIMKDWLLKACRSYYKKFTIFCLGS